LAVTTGVPAPIARGATRTATAKGEASGSAHAQKTYRFFQPQEAAFIEAALARLIPNDDAGPGAVEAGVPHFMDAQLSGAWGAGERLYRSGPWKAGTPSQGYQLPFTPAALFRTALRGVQQDLKQAGRGDFARLSPADQDAYLKDLQGGGKDFDGVPSKVFFESLWELALEGYFGDPVYGGNVGMASWKMIGFPGAYATYYDLVDQHGLAFQREPTSLAEDSARAIHVHPNIPADVGSIDAEGRTATTSHAPSRQGS